MYPDFGLNLGLKVTSALRAKADFRIPISPEHLWPKADVVECVAPLQMHSSRGRY